MDMKKEGRDMPVPSKETDIKILKCKFINFVACDTLEYRKMYNNKSVKKTLTIPEWLNEAAIAMDLNFSQALQEALIVKIQI